MRSLRDGISRLPVLEVSRKPDQAGPAANSDRSRQNRSQREWWRNHAYAVSYPGNA